MKTTNLLTFTRALLRALCDNSTFRGSNKQLDSSAPDDVSAPERPNIASFSDSLSSKPPAVVRASPTEDPFLSFFKKEELPDCELAITLLKAWIDSDPEALEMLQNMQTFDPRTVLRKKNPHFAAFIEHTHQCVKCNEVLFRS